MDGSDDSLAALSPSMGSTSAAVLLTPGRTRNIAQDMEALRLSRQDNPYLQQIIASRESLIDPHTDECDADDTILMSQEFGSSPLDLDEDPLTLKEVHEHMIRSPPPSSCWPQESVSFRATSAFDFSSSPVSYSALSVHSQEKELLGRCARRSTDDTRNATPGRRSSRSASPRSHDLSLCGRPLSLPGESHLRAALGKKSSNCDRFSLLQHPLRRTRCDDNDHLVVE